MEKGKQSKMKIINILQIRALKLYEFVAELLFTRASQTIFRYRVWSIGYREDIGQNGSNRSFWTKN